MPLSDDLFTSISRVPDAEKDYLLFNKERNSTILNQAAMLGFKEIIVAILKKYSQRYTELGGLKLIHAQDFFYGNTPLLWAIANTMINGALSLLDQNIITDVSDMRLQINMVDDKGKTPLMLSIAKGPSHQHEIFGGACQLVVIEQLLALSADVTIYNHKRQTALHYAAAHRDISLMKRLIAAGADLMQPDIDGHTPIHMANFTEKQADAFLYDSAKVFTRESAKWMEDEFVFKAALDEMAGQSTAGFTPLMMNVRSYLRVTQAKPTTDVINLAIERNKAIINGALALFESPVFGLNCVDIAKKTPHASSVSCMSFRFFSAIMPHNTVKISDAVLSIHNKAKQKPSY